MRRSPHARLVDSEGNGVLISTFSLSILKSSKSATSLSATIVDASSLKHFVLKRATFAGRSKTVLVVRDLDMLKIIEDWRRSSEKVRNTHLPSTTRIPNCLSHRIVRLQAGFRYILHAVQSGAVQAAFVSIVVLRDEVKLQ